MTIEPQPAKPTMSDEARRLANQRRRSVMIALVLAAAVVLFYVLTIAKMGANIFDRPL